MIALRLALALGLATSCAAQQPPERPSDIAGRYDTSVALAANSCGAVEVRPFPTVVTHAAGDSVFTLAHGPLTYHGRLFDGGRFVTDTQTIAVEGGTVAVSVDGSFAPNTFTASARVGMRQRTPCDYVVEWRGTKEEGAN
jgi:hypothetical protein